MSAISKAAWLPVCALAGLHFITLSAQAQPEPATGPARAPPRLGQHSREVLREAGYTDASIDTLIANGAVCA